MDSRELREELNKGRLIADGAFGTYFEQKYGKEAGIPELANLTAPEHVRAIHREYIDGGARLLRTNTFASNTMLLDSLEEVQENIRAGYENAVEAVAQSGKNVMIAADIGPIYEADNYIGVDVEKAYIADTLEEKDILEEYQSICETFLECGASCFVFETLADFSYMDSITAYIKKRAPEAFILLQFSVDKTGYTKSGLSMQGIITRAAGMHTIDGYGFNCGVAAAHLKQLLEQQVFPNDKYLVAMPNGSYPYLLRGKMVYSNNEKYYVKMMDKVAKLGVNILGGCCGTTPAYIAHLEKALREQPNYERRTVGVQCLEDANLQNDAQISEGKQQRYSDFAQKLQRGEKVFVVELDPPFQMDITKIMEGAKRLKESQVDMITLADSPMARVRMDALQLGSKMQREIQIPVMPHICCRDKNVIAMRSGMMGAYINDIRHLLIVTGDPVARSDREHISSVFDFNSIKLMQQLSEMNQEFFEKEPYFYLGALNYHGVNVEAIMRRMQQKIDRGCGGFLTQPVYSKEDMERICYLKEHVDTKIICGIMPLVNYKNAMFIKNEMPGIKVSDEIVARYRPEMTREEAEIVATEISVEIMEKLYDHVDGFYMMTPFNRAALIGGIVDRVKQNHER